MDTHRASHYNLGAPNAHQQRPSIPNKNPYEDALSRVA
jgi:hypothetical protein